MLSSCASGAQPPDLAPEAFRQAVSRGDSVQILDVRTQEEYNSGHIANALLADWNERSVFEERVKALDKSKPVYTYCLVGGRSSAAAARLRADGFSEVYNLQGGIKAWKAASLPVEGRAEAPQMTVEEFRAMIPAEGTVLVNVGAAWCPPCRKMAPVLDELVRSDGRKFKLVKIDGGAQEALAASLGAATFPTFIVYKNGKEVWRASGVVALEELQRRL